jgi:GNAT superfamily N-acetyltransferase
MSYAIEVAAPADIRQAIEIDDEACLLYAEAGLVFSLTDDHPFAVSERRRWESDAAAGRLFFARDASGARVGFAALDRFDGAAYLDQLSVRRAAMRRGAGRFLLRHALDWARAAGESSIWLTTYGHLPWNRPFYESEGFTVVPEAEAGPGVRRDLDAQRRALPAPGERVAMRARLVPQG